MRRVEDSTTLRLRLLDYRSSIFALFSACCRMDKLENTRVDLTPA